MARQTLQGEHGTVPPGGQDAPAADYSTKVSRRGGVCAEFRGRGHKLLAAPIKWQFALVPILRGR